MNKIKEMLKSMLLQFGGVQTDKGELTYLGDKQLEIGDEVYIDGETAPDGDYTDESGNIFVVKDGKVEEIKDKEVEEEKPVEEKPETEELEETAPETPETETPETEPEKDDLIEKLEGRVAELERTLAELVERVSKIETAPVTKPVVDEFEQVGKKNSTGNKTVDKYSRIFGSK